MNTSKVEGLTMSLTVKLSSIHIYLLFAATVAQAYSGPMCLSVSAQRDASGPQHSSPTDPCIVDLYHAMTWVSCEGATRRHLCRTTCLRGGVAPL